MDYDGDVCVWRGVVVRVIDVDDDGGDVEVCFLVAGVVVGGALHRPDRATQSPSDHRQRVVTSQVNRACLHTDWTY